MNLHIIIHESFEAPAAIEVWALQRHHNITYTHLYEGDTLPSVPNCDFLVVMGGPQSPATTTEESPHFDGPKEKAFIKAAVEQGAYVLGVCLGAQLIGDALGGTFEHSPNREIGVFPADLTEEGSQDPNLGQLPATFMVGHWHGDMPGLTPGATILATSKGCPRQIVRYTPKVYGFQCHFEFTPRAIEGLITHCTDVLEQYKDQPYVESPAQLRAHDYTEMNELLFSFLDRFTTS